MVALDNLKDKLEVVRHSINQSAAMVSTSTGILKTTLTGIRPTTWLCMRRY